MQFNALPDSTHLVATVGNVVDPFMRKLVLRGRATLLRPARAWRRQGSSAKSVSFLRRTQSGHWGLGRKREMTRCPWTQGPDGWAAGRGFPSCPWLHSHQGLNPAKPPLHREASEGCLLTGKSAGPSPVVVSRRPSPVDVTSDLCKISLAPFSPWVQLATVWGVVADKSTVHPYCHPGERTLLTPESPCALCNLGSLPSPAFGRPPLCFLSLRCNCV